MKITTHLDHISHCQTTSGTNWSNRWTYRVSIINSRRGLIQLLPRGAHAHQNVLFCVRGTNLRGSVIVVVQEMHGVVGRGRVTGRVKIYSHVLGFSRALVRSLFLSQKKSVSVQTLPRCRSLF